MTTEEVAKRQDGAIALPDEGALGMSGQFDRGDVSTPACSIVQPTSASDRGDPGYYWFPDDSCYLTNFPVPQRLCCHDHSSNSVFISSMSSLISPMSAQFSARYP